MSICSDFEALIRTYFSVRNDAVYSINEIIEIILKDDKLKPIFEEEVILEHYAPFKPLNIINYYGSNNFEWWKSYNKIKHNKFKSIHYANQKSVIYALASLYILNNYILTILTNPEGIDIFTDDRRIFKLKNLKQKTISTNGLFLTNITYANE